MIRIKHIVGLFAVMAMLVLSSCHKLDDLEPGSEALLPTRAVYSGDEVEDVEAKPSKKDAVRTGEEDSDDGVDNVNDDDDDEEDDEEQSLNGLPQ